MRFTITCDGAAAPTNPGPSSYGFVKVTWDGSIEVDKQESKLFLGWGTNQTAELTAAIHGLRSVPEGVEVKLVSDSQYVLNGITDWRVGWERNGYRTAKKKPIANRGLWLDLFKEVDLRRVTCEWVRGHSGHPENERADELATLALIEAGVKVE